MSEKSLINGKGAAETEWQQQAWIWPAKENHFHKVRCKIMAIDKKF
jgi:hypothetical protein